MENRKISLKAVIVCTAIALTVITCVLSFLSAPAYARTQPMETVLVGQLSDIEDGYDAGLCDICYEIAVPVF